MARKTAKARGLTPKQERFVQEYLIDLNASQAAARAGYSAKSAEYLGYQLLQKPLVQVAIQKRRDKLAERAELTAIGVLQRWAEIANADPRDLVEYRRGCCRHCWGFDHAYQWTASEWQEAERNAITKGLPLPDNSGGIDFHIGRDPNPVCPQCAGEGRGRMIVADTRKLTGGAARLYAGVKLGKDGLEVKLHDQMAALVNIARHLGMFPSKVELTGKDGGPLRVVKELSDDDLAAIIARGSSAGATDTPEGPG